MFLNNIKKAFRLKCFFILLVESKEKMLENIHRYIFTFRGDIMKNDKFLGNGQNLGVRKERLYYLDYLKLFLITIVVSHHSLEAYMPKSEWQYKDIVQSRWLENIHVINMTFLMGIFFFISGYLVVNSIKKRSAKDFILSKAKYLLSPIILIGAVIVPLQNYIVGRAMNKINSSFFDYYIKIYWGTGIMTYEHGWYVLSLFLFSILYLVFKSVIGEKAIKSIGRLSFKKLFIISIVIAACTCVMHMYYSFDQWIVVLGFIGLEPVHYPQYIILFITGAIAYENNWLDQITDKMGWTALSFGLAVVAFICCKDLFNIEIINKIYASYYIYEAFVAIAICIGLLFIFKKYFNGENKVFAELSKCTFGVYVWHIFFVFIFQLLLGQCKLAAMLKYLIVTILSIITTFTFVYLKKKLINGR